MKTTLQQQQFLHRKVFEIGEKGLHVRAVHPFGGGEYYVGFDELGLRAVKVRAGRRNWLIAFFGFVVLSLTMLVLQLGAGEVEKGAWLVYLSMAVVCGGVYLVSYKRRFYLPRYGQASPVEFFADRPSAAEFAGFLQTLQEKRNAFLIAQYGMPTVMAPYDEQRRQLLWLTNVDALTNEQYRQKMEELNALFSGFSDIRNVHMN